jgi:methionyl-tRNA formyltransferase
MVPDKTGALPPLPLTLAFMGSADFSIPTLDALIAAGHRIVAVYTQPPRPAGRGHKPRLPPVHRFADGRGLPVRTPATLKSAEEQASFRDLALDAAVVAAYGLILPQPILDAPRLGCLNVHGSLLPRWRGAAPIQRAILEGDAETGVTIMQMDRGLDTGPVFCAEAVPITATTTAAQLHDTLAALGARMMVDVLAGRAAGRVRATPQPAEGATYAQKLERDEGRLDWTRPATVLERAVRALNPAPGVWFEHAGERIKVLAASLAEGSAAPPGTVIDESLTVACGEGALRLLELQRAGRAPMSAAALLRGYPLPPGTRLQ